MDKKPGKEGGKMNHSWRACVFALTGMFAAVSATGCHFGGGPGFDHPFALGQVSDSHWETQQTNAEAADFIFYDHDFVGDGEKLTPSAKKKLESVALRIPHVPFPVVVEESPNNRAPELDGRRRRVIVEQLGRLGAVEVEDRVVIAPAFAEGFTAMEGERAYVSGITTNFGTGYGAGFGGRRGGGFGGVYR